MFPLATNSEDFVFDNPMLAQIPWHGQTIVKVSCLTKGFPEASSINVARSVRYGIGCLKTGLQYRLAKVGMVSSPLFPAPATRAEAHYAS